MKQGWVTKKFDDIIESNVIGLTKNSSEQDAHHMFKYVKMNNITRDNRFDLSKYICVNADKREVDKYSLSDGDFLFNTRNSYELVGKTCLFEGYNNEVVLYNNNIMRIRFVKNINPFFINYLFSTDDIIKKLDTLKSGTTNVSAIYYKDLKNLELSFPPLHEQQRIVAILDTAFAAIDKAKANAEQNLKNTKELFDSYLQNIFDTKVEGLEEKILGEVCEIDPKKSELKGFDVNHLVSFLPMKDLGISQNQIIPINTRKLSEVMGSYTYFRDNDILLAKVTPCFENGKLGIAKNLTNGIGFGSSEYIVFRPLNNVLSEYVFYLLSSNKFRNDGKKLMFGATGLKRLSKDYVRNFLIQLPSIKQQQTIVQKLDALSLETKKLEAIYQKKINDLEELKKSVLQKAFAGELKEKLVTA